MARTRVPAFAARHRTSVVVGAGLAAMVAVQMIASPALTAGSASSVPNGQLLASNCMQCHGTNGMSGSFNQLAGIPVKDMMNKLHDQQTHKSIMGAQARGYTDAELVAIAGYFASLPKP